MENNWIDGILSIKGVSYFNYFFFEYIIWNIINQLFFCFFAMLGQDRKEYVGCDRMCWIRQDRTGLTTKTSTLLFKESNYKYLFLQLCGSVIDFVMVLVKQCDLFIVPFLPFLSLQLELLFTVSKLENQQGKKYLFCTTLNNFIQILYSLF